MEKINTTKMIEPKKFNWKVFYYSVLFIFMFLVLWKTPLISDDFEFANLALTNPSELLSYVLYYGNGRLIGNLIGVFFVNFPLLNGLIRSFSFCVLIWLLSKINVKNNIFFVLISSILILGANPFIMGQIFTWSSGWANFVIPIILLLSCVHIIRNSEKFTIFRACSIGVISFISQFFTEHTTIIHIIVAASFLVYYRLQKNNEKFKYACAWIIACVFGAILMFILPKIFFVDGNRTEGYRNFHFQDFLSQSISATIFIVNTMTNCTLLWACFSVFGVYVNKKGHTIAKFKKILYIFYPIFTIVQNEPHIAIGTVESVLRVIKYLLFFVYIVTLAIDIFSIKDNPKKHTILWLILISVVSLAPFLIITPFGERCMYLAYVILCIASIICLSYCLDNGMELYLKSLCCGSTVVLILVSIVIGVSFAKIYHYDQIRDKYIRECIEKGDKEIIAFDLPTAYTFRSYLLDYYYYDQEPHDVKIETVDLETWIKNGYGN